MEAIAEDRFPEQIVNSPVPQIVEVVGEVVLTTPQECVHNRAPELIVGFPVRWSRCACRAVYRSRL